MPSTQRSTLSDKLDTPVDDPETLIRARNAEQRRRAKAAKASTSAVETTVTPPTSTAQATPEVPLPFLAASSSIMQPQGLPFTPGAFSNTSGSTPKEGPPAGSSTLPSVPRAEDQSTNELVRLLLSAQHASTVQSLAADRCATQDRLAQFEHALL